MKSFLERLNNVGFERTRRAVAALALSLFVFLYLLISLNPPGEEWRLAFLALSACYGVAFMGVAAEWFWGRWFAAGLGYSGVMVAAASFAMVGWSPALAIYGALHGLVVLALAGKKMAARFDLQTAWRERYGMDEFGVARLRKTVTRASASLPSVILWALAPKEPGQGMIFGAAGLLALAGLAGVLRRRTWGLLTLGAASMALLAAGTGWHPAFATSPGGLLWPLGAGGSVPATFPALLLLGAVVPFLRPAARFLRAPR